MNDVKRLQKNNVLAQKGNIYSGNLYNGRPGALREYQKDASSPQPAKCPEFPDTVTVYTQTVYKRLWPGVVSSIVHSAAIQCTPAGFFLFLSFSWA